MQQLAHPLVDVTLGCAADAKPERDIFKHRHVPKQRVMLKHKADVAVAGRAVVTSSSSYSRLPRSAASNPGDDSQQGRLAGARRTEQRQQGTGRHNEADVVEGHEVAEFLGHVLNGDGQGVSWMSVF